MNNPRVITLTEKKLTEHVAEEPVKIISEQTIIKVPTEDKVIEFITENSIELTEQLTITENTIELEEQLIINVRTEEKVVEPVTLENQKS